ncbi:MAG: hypothetical protein J6T86_07990 [Bacteroidales bacterium]|nr:hypothetical protein [Bacteroidales bacterium]
MDKLLATYSLLGYLKETSSSKAAISELYIPLVKKALSEYAKEHGLIDFKGRSLTEISDKIFAVFEISIPLPILGKILENIEYQINDKNIFELFNDGSFIIKSYVFNDIDELFEQEGQNINLLKDDYCTYCQENGYQFDFEDLKKFILAQNMELFSDKRSDLLDLDYFVPKYVSERLDNSSIFELMGKIYLGSIIESYLKQNITTKVTDAELLLDTNFFISLIDLNTEDAFHTCNQVFDLCRQLGYRFSMLYSTFEQIQILLSNRINDFANKDYIGSVKCADVFSACIRRNIDKTTLERIKDNVFKTIYDKGITIIKEAQIREIVEKASKSREYKDLIQSRQNNKESALNDVVAKYYVEKKRGQNIKEFVDAKCWFLHNSYSPYDYSYGRKIHDRYLISANELLVLLWLSNPAQGQNISISDITKGGLASYVTKYRRSKMPTRETLKIIKKRADDALSIGSITEKDSFNLCIRMAEGHLTQKEVDESLLADNVTVEQFAKKLKEYTSEEENLKLKQKHDAETEIEGLNKKIEEKDLQIQGLNERLKLLEKDKYLKDKDEFVNSKMSKLAKDTWINVILILAICALWCVNEFYKAALPTIWSIIIAIGAAVATTFGTLLLRKTKFKDYFCRKGLRERLEKEFDESHNTKDN